MREWGGGGEARRVLQHVCVGSAGEGIVNVEVDCVCWRGPLYWVRRALVIPTGPHAPHQSVRGKRSFCKVPDKGGYGRGRISLRVCEGTGFGALKLLAVRSCNTNRQELDVQGWGGKGTAPVVLPRLDCCPMDCALHQSWA